MKKKKNNPLTQIKRAINTMKRTKKFFFAIHDCYLFIDEFRVDSRIWLAWIELGFDSILFIYLSFLCSFYLFYFLSCLVVVFFYYHSIICRLWDELNWVINRFRVCLSISMDLFNKISRFYVRPTIINIDRGFYIIKFSFFF